MKPEIVYKSEQINGIYYEVKFWESSNEFIVYKIDTEKLKLGVQKIPDLGIFKSLEAAILFINTL